MQPQVKLLGVTEPVGAWEYDNSVGDRFFRSHNPGIEEPLDIIEYAGRWDYGPKSIAKMGDRDIIRRWLKAGEESMLEMVSVVVQITCSRVVSHELVRHRIASYQQESQRYVKYEEEDPEELFFLPPEIEAAGEGAIFLYKQACSYAQSVYQSLKLEYGLKSQIARYVLPNATRTRIVVSMNLREWRHVLKLRMHRSAQPEMQEVARQCFEILNDLFPEVFGDIPAFLEEGERAAR